MTTYTISLDDVDLALLPMRSATNDYLKKEYFQFQLMSKEHNEEPTTSAQHPCHICAIDLPAEFLNEHFASVKHKANVRIASEAAQRMRAFINTILPPVKSQPNGKFCDSCSTVAAKDHDKTKEHTIAVIHDRMLCDLMKIYVGDDPLKTDDKERENNDVLKDESAIVVREDTSKLNNQVTPAKTDINNEANANQVPQMALQKDNNVLQNGEEEANVPNGINKPDFFKIDHETYIKLLNNVPTYPKAVIQAVGGNDNIQIIINNERINVSTDHFHSFHRMEGKIQCRVCYCTVTVAEEETHKLSVVHMKKIVQVVSNSHCIREIYENWCHCILCNQVVKSTLVEGHKLTELHREKKAIATVTQAQAYTAHDDKVIQNNAGASGIQATQSTTVPTENAAKNTLVNGQNITRYRQFGANSKPKNMAVANSNPKEELHIEYPYKATGNPMSVYCLICECAVPSKLSNRVDHLKGLRHKNSSKTAKKSE